MAEVQVLKHVAFNTIGTVSVGRKGGKKTSVKLLLLFCWLISLWQPLNHHMLKPFVILSIKVNVFLNWRTETSATIFLFCKYIVSNIVGEYKISKTVCFLLKACDIVSIESHEYVKLLKC